MKTPTMKTTPKPPALRARMPTTHVSGATVLAAAFLAAFAALAVAPPAEAQVRGVVLYEHTHYQGTADAFAEDVPSLAPYRIGNDRVSSVRVEPGCTATLYEHDGYRGRALTVTADVPVLAGTAIGDDRVSSLRVRCAATGAGSVVVYEHADYRGRSYTFDGDVEALDDHPLGDNVASSVRVSPGCSVTLYEHPSFRGRHQTFFEDDPSFKGVGIGDNTTSSLRVRCEGAAPSPAPPPRAGGPVAEATYRCRDRNQAVAVRIDDRGNRSWLLLDGAEVAALRAQGDRDRIRLVPIGDTRGELEIDLRRNELLSVLPGGTLRSICVLR